MSKTANLEKKKKNEIKKKETNEKVPHLDLTIRWQVDSGWDLAQYRECRHFLDEERNERALREEEQRVQWGLTLRCPIEPDGCSLSL